MADRNEIIGILSNAKIENHSLTSRIAIEKLANYLISEGVELRPRAEWVTEYGFSQCSICHSPAPNYYVKLGIGDTQLRSRRTDFCPHCGAKMIGG